MEKNDFWTTIIAAVLVLVASSPSLVPPAPGLNDNYGALRVLLLIGPAAMVILALVGRFRRSDTSSRSGSDDDD